MKPKEFQTVVVTRIAGFGARRGYAPPDDLQTIVKEVVELTWKHWDKLDAEWRRFVVETAIDKARAARRAREGTLNLDDLLSSIASRGEALNLARFLNEAAGEIEFFGGDDTETDPAFRARFAKCLARWARKDRANHVPLKPGASGTDEGGVV